LRLLYYLTRTKITGSQRFRALPVVRWHAFWEQRQKATALCGKQCVCLKPWCGALLLLAWWQKRLLKWYGMAKAKRHSQRVFWQGMFVNSLSGRCFMDEPAFSTKFHCHCFSDKGSNFLIVQCWCHRIDVLVLQNNNKKVKLSIIALSPKMFFFNKKVI
jgi:hypothetical protein